MRLLEIVLLPELWNFRWKNMLVHLFRQLFWQDDTRQDKTRQHETTQTKQSHLHNLLACLNTVDGVFCPQREIERMSDGRNTNSILYQSKMDVYQSNLSHNCKISYTRSLWALNSSWRTFGPLDFVIRPFRLCEMFFKAGWLKIDWVNNDKLVSTAQAVL